MRLAARDTIHVEISLRQIRPFATAIANSTRITKQKELLKIKSDFFDQKVPIIIYPAVAQTTTNSSSTSNLQNAAAR